MLLHKLKIFEKKIIVDGDPYGPFFKLANGDPFIYLIRRIFRFVFNIYKKKNNCACLIKFNDEDDGNFLGRINKRDEKPAIRIESGVYVTVCTACCYIR